MKKSLLDKETNILFGLLDGTLDSKYTNDEDEFKIKSVESAKRR